MVEPRFTETFTLVAQKLNLARARADIAGYAQAFELQIDSIEERPKRLSVEIMITVTGTEKMIDLFREQMGGDAWDTTVKNPQDIPVAMFLSWLTRLIQRARRHRMRSS